jgi:hypothetical protein
VKRFRPRAAATEVSFLAQFWDPGWASKADRRQGKGAHPWNLHLPSPRFHCIFVLFLRLQHFLRVGT